MKPSMVALVRDTISCANDDETLMMWENDYSYDVVLWKSNYTKRDYKNAKRARFAALQDEHIILLPPGERTLLEKALLLIWTPFDDFRYSHAPA